MSQTTSGSTPSLLIEFFNKRGMPYSPTTFAFRIFDVDSAILIRGPEFIPPAAKIEILMSSYDTHIVNGNNANERRRILWVSDEGTPQQATGQYIFDIESTNP